MEELINGLFSRAWHCCSLARPSYGTDKQSLLVQITENALLAPNDPKVPFAAWNFFDTVHCFECRVCIVFHDGCGLYWMSQKCLARSRRALRNRIVQPPDVQQAHHTYTAGIEWLLYRRLCERPSTTSQY